MAAPSTDLDARRTAAFLGLATLASVAIYLLARGGDRPELTAGATTFACAALGAIVVRRRVRRGTDWPSAREISIVLAMLALVAALLFVLELVDPSVYRPRLLDASLLLFLVPLWGGIRHELRRHFSLDDRREIGIDVALIAASLAAIAYVVIRPIESSGAASISAAIFAIVAASMFTAFGALALRSPSRPHVLLGLGFAVISVAVLQFGWEWSHRLFTGASAGIDIPLMLGPLAIAATVAGAPHGADGDAELARWRWARPVLMSTAVIAAAASLAIVAMLAEERALPRGQSIVIIGLLGIGIAGRILSDQMASAEAHRDTKSALEQKDAALRGADVALDRVRETNETLRQSEEHLRLVFETAVDGIVELSAAGDILRANGAFCRMLGMDRQAIEDQPWSAVAASIDGPEGSLAELPVTGHAQIERPDGQQLHLEARLSDVPTNPPRRLLLVRDATAAKVADQTIRSLFQFLQDRDEDRTRLLRRTNAAIESERNRIARDLHDGPVQGVSAASLSLEAALLMIKAGDLVRGIDVLTKIRQELAEEADALRRLMSGLRPPVLEERGLIPALRETLARFGVENEVRVEFTGALSQPVPTDIETLAYRIVQEAITNTGKHASAGHVTVHVASDPTQLRVEVEDDGSGFDIAQTREFLRMGRVGLASMRERVELASGTLNVRSAPSRGTTITATLPLDASIVSRELAAREA